MTHQARTRTVAPTGFVLVINDLKILGVQRADLTAA